MSEIQLTPTQSQDRQTDTHTRTPVPPESLNIFNPVEHVGSTASGVPKLKVRKPHKKYNFGAAPR